MLTPQRGFSLVELMVGLLLGAIALAAVASLYQTTAVNVRRQLEVAHLDGVVRQTLSLITSDIRRSGYWHLRPGVDRPGDNPFQSVVNDIRVGQYEDETDDSCLLLAYDLDDDGKVGVGQCNGSRCADWSDTDNVEQFGFRLRAGRLEMRFGGDEFSCNTGDWQSVTDDAVDVSRFLVRVSGTCLNLDIPETACVPNGRQIWHRAVDVDLQAQVSRRPEVRVTRTRHVPIMNDRLVRSRRM